MISLTRWATSIAIHYTTCVIKMQAYAIFLRPNRPPARQKILFQAAGGVRRPKKDFSNARQPSSALEKSSPARLRPPARQKSLFQHATVLQRTAQDFSNAILAASAVQKTFPTRQISSARSEIPPVDRGWSRLGRSHGDGGQLKITVHRDAAPAHPTLGIVCHWRQVLAASALRRPLASEAPRQWHPRADVASL